MSRLRILLILCALLLLAAPAAASAAEPYAETQWIDVTSATTAVFGGFVDTGGEATDAAFKWDTEESDFCFDEDGSAASAFASDPAHIAAGPDTEFDVSANVSGLTAGAWYCFALVATNPSGFSDGGFGWFQAGAPDAYTDDLALTGAGTATVTGSVYPSGQSSKYFAEYDDADSEWCDSEGWEGTPANSTDPIDLDYTDSAYHDVSVDVTGLVAGNAYCIQIAAANGTSKASGGVIFFVAGYPDAYTDAVEELGATSARVTGAVNPSGQTTTYYAEYDVATSDWCINYGESGTPASATTEQSLEDTDSDYHDVTVDLTGLTAGTQYCAQLVAHNGSGDVAGGIVFVTVGHAHAVTGAAKPSGADGATVAGTVNPGAQAATYKVNYDLADTPWCQSLGAQGTPANSTATATLPFTDDQSHDVTVDLTGLASGTAYCVELVAHNGAGDVSGGFATVSTGLPLVTLGDPESGGPASEVLSGTVNPSNRTTTWYIQYAEAGTEFCDTDGKSGEATSGPAHTLELQDTSGHAVSEALEGLTAGSTYCARLVASNDAGQAATDTVEFAVAPPTAKTAPATGVTATGAALHGVVNPGGFASSYHFEYALASSTFCQTNGASGARVSSGLGDAGDGTAGQAVSQAVAGLKATTGYCFRAVAFSEAGTAVGDVLTFKTVAAPPGGGGGGPKPAGTIAAAKSRRAAKDGTFNVGTLACASAFPCAAAIKVKGAKKVAGGNVTVAAHRAGPLKVALTKKGRTALEKAKKLTVTVTVEVTSKGAISVFKQFQLTLKAPKKKK
jgi:general stress protein CsbA